ncbi:hypothetical protein MOQ_005162 [Trypanosoma cruzi marinkellei]|uniref:Uncharacterized protein n=1 Tax=Trypanosoma cruzi marinkellei TaxID=85056 RepID=K2NQ48_TRYCR|nr:hypothetical protein MOQ_005162 [Trypanosoma cruzi marinkellei]
MQEHPFCVKRAPGMALTHRVHGGLAPLLLFSKAKRVLWLVLMVSFYVDVASASDTLKSVAPFRCMRPFESLPRFSSANMDAGENCRLGPFRVINAKAMTQCVREYDDEDDTARATSPTCSVTLRVTFQTEGDKKRHHAGGSTVAGSEETFGSEAYRFSLRLRAFNDSVVEYKGFDQNGYSMCCQFIEGSECSWEMKEKEKEEEGANSTQQESATSQEGDDGRMSHAPQRREAMVVSCPIRNPVVPGIVFHGAITKPLHRLVITEWEARLELWRGRAHEKVFLGRVLVPFRLTEDDIASAQSNAAAKTTTTTSTAMTATESSKSGKMSGGVLVVTEDVIKERNGSEDL